MIKKISNYYLEIICLIFFLLFFVYKIELEKIHFLHIPILKNGILLIFLSYFIIKGSIEKENRKTSFYTALFLFISYVIFLIFGI